jgi:sugar phosphate isomerase/epimerase
MPFSKLGYALSGEGSPQALDDQLQSLVDNGCDYAEIDGGPWDAWIGGRVNRYQLNRLLGVLDKHRDHLSYTLHLPGQVNLFDLADRDVHERLLRSGIEVGRAIRAESMVYHPGWRTIPPAGTSVSLFDLMSQERATLRGLADEVATWGSHIAIETWIDTKSRYGYGYSYGLWPELLAIQVETIDHPAVGLCLDFVHTYIAARWYGFDFMKGIARLAPLVTHLHVADTIGVKDFTNYEDPGLGRGDLALPPGWGIIPFDEVFSQISFPECRFLTLELRDRFFVHLEYVLAETRRLASLRDGPNVTRPEGT